MCYFQGKYRLVDNTPFLVGLWNCYRDCQYVENEGGVLFYKSPTFDPAKKTDFE